MQHWGLVVRVLVPCIAMQILNHWTTREIPILHLFIQASLLRALCGLLPIYNMHSSLRCKWYFFHYSLFVCDDIEIRRVKSPLLRALQPVSGRAGARTQAAWLQSPCYQPSSQVSAGAGTLAVPAPPFNLISPSAGGRQFPSLCSRPHRPGQGLDDRLRQDCGPA